VAHRRAKLTPYGRLVLVERVLVEGWSVGETAKAASVSTATVYKWLTRFGAEGPAGLEDRSSAPRHRPRALAPSQVQRILASRRRLKVGPHRLGPMLGHPRSTVYGVLRRAGLSRLAHLDLPTATPVRYERQRPAVGSRRRSNTWPLRCTPLAEAPIRPFGPWQISSESRSSAHRPGTPADWRAQQAPEHYHTSSSEGAQLFAGPQPR
jgi:transposase